LQTEPNQFHSELNQSFFKNRTETKQKLKNLFRTSLVIAIGGWHGHDSWLWGRIDQETLPLKEGFGKDRTEGKSVQIKLMVGSEW